jgi:hypothetical protein
VMRLEQRGGIAAGACRRRPDAGIAFSVFGTPRCKGLGLKAGLCARVFLVASSGRRLAGHDKFSLSILP